MLRPVMLYGLLLLAGQSACPSSPIESRAPALPDAKASVDSGATNAGRVRSITVNPTTRNHAIIAMDFGGLWKTHSGGSQWLRIDGLPAVFVTDVEFSADGKTVVAAVFRDNRTMNGGGIYVSRDGGDVWVRPPTGIVPASNRTPTRTSAYSVSRSPDQAGLWYVGTDYGIAKSSDNGATWTHHSLEPCVSATNPVTMVERDKQQDAAQSVLAMPNRTVLAMTRTAVCRSDFFGLSGWRVIINDNFRHQGPASGAPGNGNNKMDRSPFAANSPLTFIFKDYSPTGGNIFYYELDTGLVKALQIPQGVSRGPFVRVSKPNPPEGNTITVWVGAGWDGYFVTRATSASFRDLQVSDWTSFIKTAGIHSDMGDMGVDGNFQPTLMGTDGGIYKPHRTIPGRWMNAAVPGSGMNSLLITSLAGTNPIEGATGTTKAPLYFATQDNSVWASPDEGQTWPKHEGGEGFGLQVTYEARIGTPVTVAFVSVPGGEPSRFTDAVFANSRTIPNLDQNGQPLDKLKQAFLLRRDDYPTLKPSAWVRLRTADSGGEEIYVSENDGANWTKTGQIGFEWAGGIKRSAGGAVVWMPVKYKSLWGTRIGLIVHTAKLGLPMRTYGYNDIVFPTDYGGMGQRATEFDWQAVFGVHPGDWQHLIVPDVRENNIKVTRDGGRTWIVDAALTAQVLRGGELKLYDDSPYWMHVTEIAFDPYSRPGTRIFIGTRDAGIICSADNGRNWSTIRNSDQIKYITGFHFLRNGGVYVSSYGHGLWFVKPTNGCPESYKLPWDRRQPVLDADVKAAEIRKEFPTPPTGTGDAGHPQLFLKGTIMASGIAIVGTDNTLTIAGRNFPAGSEVTLLLKGSNILNQKVRVNSDGTFSTTVRFSGDLQFGTHNIEVAGDPKSPALAVADFVKPYVGK
ncbi:MAG TPA: hypothetical protein VIT19_03920 [Pyrinomonadaceae bacterium]